jgi:hypothetical protein
MKTRLTVLFIFQLTFNTTGMSHLKKYTEECQPRHKRFQSSVLVRGGWLGPVRDSWPVRLCGGGAGDVVQISLFI